MRIAVVTAIIGDVDELHDPALQSVEADWYCFSNLKRSSKIWKLQPEIHGDIFPGNTNMQAKWYKWQTHKIPILSDYDWLVWIDASIEVGCGTFIEDFIKCAENGYAFYQHPNRECAYREMNHSYGIPKYRHINFEELHKKYNDEGFPEDWGLWASGVHVKKNVPEISKIFDMVWEEVKTQGEQDQIAMSYAFWKSGNRPSTFNPEGGLYHSKYIRKRLHKNILERLGRK